jgi:hypothetical protein
MSTELRARAETRLAEAAAALDLADPRAPLRDRLRQLREQQPDAFERAVAHYEQTVLRALAAAGTDADAIAAWLDYGLFVGRLTSNGRLTAIDATGRATPWRQGLEPGSLVLFLPEDTGAPALVAAGPRQPSAAQHATLALLIERKLSL